MGNTNDFVGYKPESIKYFKKFKAKTWSKIRISNQLGTTTGVILPRNEFAPDGYVELKLNNGYNIGIPLDAKTNIEVLSQEPPMELKFNQITPKHNPKLPDVQLLGVGGTISSRLDYVTGAVIPAFEPSELFAAVPELADVCNLQTEVLYQIFSENMKIKYWLETAQKIAKIANSGTKGILLAHGTDTMSYTAAALAFLLKDLTVPVVLVGSQRSSDRPSSDAAMNLLNAAYVAGNADLAEVSVCMMGETSHDYGLIHRGTRVRKMHSSRRDAFRTIGDTPLGIIQNRQIRYFTDDYAHRPTGQQECYTAKNIEEKVALIHVHPDLPCDLLDFYIDKQYKGIVLAGTGLGHVSTNCYPALQRAQDAHIPVLMTVQTLWGYTGMDVYETGRRLQNYGVIPGKNMLPEVAFTKMAWVLGNYTNEKEIRNILTTNIAGEITEREPMNGYQINQGIENSITSYRNSSLVKKPIKNPKKKKKTK